MSSKKKSSRISYIGSRVNYDAENVMAKRRAHLDSMCQYYSDVMRPSSMMRKHWPSKDNFHYYVTTNMAFCAVPGVASGHLKLISSRSKEATTNNAAYGAKLRGFHQNFNRTLFQAKKVILVRHPLERLVSAYR